ncbi:hypothetical protein B0H10DRAFT_1950019 [Mycena sp. CBHHK59/15]|nr:hypothetical protein B0H10DRAFT_1950019 [Mycena sp. CBHHK59/15]
MNPPRFLYVIAQKTSRGYQKHGSGLNKWDPETLSNSPRTTATPPRAASMLPVPSGASNPGAGRKGKLGGGARVAKREIGLGCGMWVLRTKAAQREIYGIRVWDSQRAECGTVPFRPNVQVTGDGGS